MSRGTPSEISGVHNATPPASGPASTPVTAPGTSAGAGRGGSATASKILVTVLVGLFLLGACSFAVAVMGAKPGASPSASASGLAGGAGLAAVGAAAADSDALLAAAPAATSGDPSTAPSPDLTPCPDTNPTTSPGPDASAALPTDAAVAPVASPDQAAAAGSSPAPAASGQPQPSDPGSLLASPEPSATDISPCGAGLGANARMPFVPVVDFWSTDTSISRVALMAALKGQGSYPRVVVPSADRAAIADALGIRIADSVQSADPAGVIAAVHKGALGLLRASDLAVSVRALGIDGKQLIGESHVKTLADWPLVASVPTTEDAAWDQKKVWTMLAAGDSMTDRGIYQRVVREHKGVDYPFEGGHATVSGHYCCGPFYGQLVPRYTLSGPSGAVRDLVQNADLAIANHESPDPVNWRFHLNGTSFSSSPALEQMFVHAGIDWFSLANNHIKDYGTDGVKNTLKVLDRVGIKHGGAGIDLAHAKQVSYLETKGVRIGIVACVGVAPLSWASAHSGGGLPCKNKYILPAIAEAQQHADMVIVFAHWGIEYSRRPLKLQRRLASDWVAAGADLILGAHPHVPGAMEQIDGHMVFYSLGNFVFDQNWSTQTMESVLLEMTFQGDQLVQFQYHPTLIADQAQPNLLDPAADDGKRLLQAIRLASHDWLAW